MFHYKMVFRDGTCIRHLVYNPEILIEGFGENLCDDVIQAIYLYKVIKHCQDIYKMKPSEIVEIELKRK